MPRVVHFEIGADDPVRAQAFYKGVFDWDIQPWDGPEPYWLVTTGPDGELGINGGIMKRNGFANAVNTVAVPSVDNYVARVTGHRGAVAMPKMAVPGIGYLAYCTDSEGNVFGLMEADASAH